MADQTRLADLHDLTAELLIKVIKEGVPVYDKEGKEIAREPAPAAYVAQAVKFLKDNGIDAVPKQGTPLGRLASLPTFEDDDLPASFN